MGVLMSWDTYEVLIFIYFSSRLYANVCYKLGKPCGSRVGFAMWVAEKKISFCWQCNIGLRARREEKKMRIVHDFFVGVHICCAFEWSFDTSV